jgi:DivIVA domain-containing protein
VALDRQAIEKKDFPRRRRGYDPAAVDAHLSAVADEVEGLSRSRSADMLERLEALEVKLTALVESMRFAPSRRLADPAPVEPVAIERSAVASVAAAAPGGQDVIESARLIALSMALDGASREQAGRYLAQELRLADGRLISDEVYDSVAR